MKLLIAEDEILCRENLKNIDWAALGITLAAACENGEEAFKLAKEIKPDIIISDIEMPKKSGLELAKSLTNLLPGVKIIILTAYTKFEYVQKSVSLGVFEYILKPFEDETLIASVKSAIRELEAEKEKNIKYENTMRQLENGKYFLKSYFFSALSDASEKKDDLLSVFDDLNPQNKYTSMVISVENNSAGSTFSENYTLFRGILKIIAKYNVKVIPFFDISLLTFIFSSDNDISDTKADNYILNISEAICEHLNFNESLKYVIGIGKTVSNLENSVYSYKGALDALSYSFYLGFNTVICISDVEPKQGSASYENIYEEGFLNRVKVGDIDQALILLKKLFNTFKNNREEIAVVQRTCSEISARLSMCLMQCGLNPDTLFNKTDAWTVIRRYNTIDELEKFINNIVEVTVSHISFTRSNSNRDLIEQVKKYIQERPETSLNDIAEHFYHSPNYLSNIFSKETGMTIKNYIIQIRIDISKKLLAETEDSIYEIANTVGYKNPQHFSIVFKKVVGVSPTSFQANIHKNKPGE